MEETAQRMLLFALLAMLVLSPVLFADQNGGVSTQLRMVAHPTWDLGHGWYAVAWGIGNARGHGVPDNVNTFGGFGYRREAWFVETMVQKQWARDGGSWYLDFRFSRQLGKVSLFAEVSPFLGEKGLYDFSMAEYQVYKHLGVGVESENVHKESRDSLGAGPRVSCPILKVGSTPIIAALAYQLRRSEPDAFRFYLVMHPKFGKTSKSPSP